MPVTNTQDNAAKCICGTCPSYDDCAREKTEILYCAQGKSGCELSRRGCVCGSCPVHRENKLAEYYFCIGGAAK